LLLLLTLLLLLITAARRLLAPVRKTLNNTATWAQRQPNASQLGSVVVDARIANNLIHDGISLVGCALMSTKPETPPQELAGTFQLILVCERLAPARLFAGRVCCCICSRD